MMSERVQSVYIFCFSFYVILVLCHTFISNKGNACVDCRFLDIKKFMLKKKIIGSPFITVSNVVRNLTESENE